MVEIEKMKKTDAISWKHFSNPETKKTIIDMLDDHLDPLCRYVENSGRLIKVADIGGGNGMATKRLYERCDNVKVTVFDVDENKFIDPDLNYILHDARNPLAEKFDAVLCRYMLHHNEYFDQQRILFNIRDCLKPDGFATVIDVTFDTVLSYELERANAIYHWLSELKGSNRRYWMQFRSFEAYFDTAGLEMIEYHSIKHKYHPDGFLKERFDLNEAEVRDLDLVMDKKPLEGWIVNASLLK